MAKKGRILEAIEKLLPEKLARKYWDNLSSDFAKGAEGTSRVFHDATEGVSLESTWRRIEYRELKDRVNLIYHDVFPHN